MAGDLPAAGPHADAIACRGNDKASRPSPRARPRRSPSTRWPRCLPEFLGGSADLTGSNLTNWSGCKRAPGDAGGNYISYGVREFGMSRWMNGMALHGGLHPYGGTFLMFSDYARNALRMVGADEAARDLVFTHDSIGLGEDGPTHQPVEQTAPCA